MLQPTYKCNSIAFPMYLRFIVISLATSQRGNSSTQSVPLTLKGKPISGDNQTVFAGKYFTNVFNRLRKIVTKVAQHASTQ